MTTNQSFNNSKNYSQLYGLQGGSLPPQQNLFPSTSQKLKSHTDQILNQQSPAHIDLNINITPYVPKTMNPQTYQQQIEITQDQSQSQDNQYHQKKQNINEIKSITPQDQPYNFHYMNSINQQTNIGNGQNSLESTQGQFQGNKLQYQLSQDNQNQNNFSVHNPNDSIVNVKTPTFIYSNQIAHSPQLSYNGVNDTMKNLYSQLSQDVVNEDNSNKQSSLNLQSNTHFDYSQNEIKGRNIIDQFNESDLILNNLKNPYQYTNSANQNNTSQQQIQNQYYHRSAAFIKPITHKESESIIPPFIKHNDYNSTNSEKCYVQSCTNSPKSSNNQNKTSKREKPIKSLNVSSHMEELQQQQQDILNEQQKQLNSQLKKVQSLQNSFIQMSEQQNDQTSLSINQISRISNNGLQTQYQSNKKQLENTILFQHSSQTDYSDIESYLLQMNEIWSKMQTAVKTKLLRQKQQQADDMIVFEQLNSAKEQFNVYEKELNLKEQIVQKQSKENQQLKAQVQHLSDKVSYLSENVNGFQSEQIDLIKQLQAKVQEKENLIVNLQYQLKKKQKYELNTSRSERESEVIHLKQLLISKTDTITDLKIKNQMLREEIIQIGQHQVQKENTDPEQNQIFQKKKEYNLLRQKVNLLEEDLKRFSQEMNLK